MRGMGASGIRMALRLSRWQRQLRADQPASDLGPRGCDPQKFITRAARTNFRRVPREWFAIRLGGKREDVRPLDQQRFARAPAAAIVAAAAGAVGAAGAARGAGGVYEVVLASTSFPVTRVFGAGVTGRCLSGCGRSASFLSSRRQRGGGLRF